MTTRAEIRQKILREKLIAVIRLHDSTKMYEVVSALVAGGILNIEITLNTPDALRWIQWYADDGTVAIGAGTVLTPEDADGALTAGARFLVSPVYFEEMIPMAHATEACAIPGGFTPTELFRCASAGADAVKLFPLAQLGPAYLRAIRAPLPQIPLIPSNGVTLENAAEFLSAGAAALGVGTPLVNQALVDEGRFDEISRRAQTLVNIVRTGF